MTEDLPDLTPRRLLLRLPRQEAAPEMARLAGNPEITANTLEIPYPPNDRMARDWISETDRKWDRRSDRFL